MNDILEQTKAVNPISTRNIETTQECEAEIQVAQQALKASEVSIMASRAIGCATLAADESRKAQGIRRRINSLNDRKQKLVESFDPVI